MQKRFKIACSLTVRDNLNQLLMNSVKQRASVISIVIIVCSQLLPELPLNGQHTVAIAEQAVPQVCKKSVVLHHAEKGGLSNGLIYKIGFRILAHLKS